MNNKDFAFLSLEENNSAGINYSDLYDRLLDDCVDRANEELKWFELSVELVDENDYEPDELFEGTVGIFVASMQTDMHTVPVYINKWSFIQRCQELAISDSVNFKRELLLTLYHEAGHALIEKFWADEQLDTDELDEEDAVEEFAHYCYGDSCYSQLVEMYDKIDEDKDGDEPGVE